MNSISRRGRGRGSLSGWLVLGIGLLALMGLMFNGFLASYLWPFFIILPGLGIFNAVKQGGRGWAWLTIPATFITATGLVLLFTAVTGWWGSMAYLAGLIMPGSFGLGLAVYGDITRKEDVAKFGELFGKIGLGMTLLGAVFFELFLNINGLAGGITGIVIAVAMVLAGIFLLMRPRRSKPKAYKPSSLSKSYHSLADDALFDDDPLFHETPVTRETPVKSRSIRK
jgi:MFS family permease